MVFIFFGNSIFFCVILFARVSFGWLNLADKSLLLWKDLNRNSVNYNEFLILAVIYMTMVAI